MSTRLAEVQRAFTRICFEREPSEQDLALLEDDPSRWVMYRNMVRSRLFKMMRTGLPKTAEALGKDAFDEAVAIYLADHAPQTRFIREIVHELVAHALPGWKKRQDLPAHLLDLVRLENTKWAVGSLEWPRTPRTVEELDFEGRPVLNPTVRDLPISFRVDKDHREPVALEAPHRAVIYRKPDSTRLFTYVLNPMGAQLFDAWRRAALDGGSFAAGTREVLAANERQPDARFIDGMATVLADLVEQSVFLGSRAPERES